MLRSIQKLIGDKRKQLIFPIFLMSLDAIGTVYRFCRFRYGQGGFSWRYGFPV